jgi:hypothetical protein
LRRGVEGVIAELGCDQRRLAELIETRVPTVVMVDLRDDKSICKLKQQGVLVRRFHPTKSTGMMDELEIAHTILLRKLKFS